MEDTPSLFINPDAPLFDPESTGGAAGLPTLAAGGLGNADGAGIAGGASSAANPGESLPGSLPVSGTPGTEPVASPAPEVDPTGGARRCAQPSTPLLLDFEVASNGPTQALFGDFQNTLSGGTYVYPVRSAGATADPAASGLTSDVTGGHWRINGTVREPTGFGLFFECHQLDASGFIGIAFRISGAFAEPGALVPGSIEPAPGGADAGAGGGAAGAAAEGTPGAGVEGEVAVVLGSAANDVARGWFLQNGQSPPGPSFGRCFPATTQFDGTCQGARLSIPFGAEPREVVVLFADLAAGSPEAGLNPAELSTVAWQLPVPGGDAGVEPYAVELVLDDIRFVAP